jgi:hypothetical protein
MTRPPDPFKLYPDEPNEPPLRVVEPPEGDDPGPMPTPAHPNAPTTTGTVPSHPLHTVTLEEFAAVEEEGAEPLLGDRNQALIPEDGDVMIYGDGGAGKTTLALDLTAHWAAGDDWLGIRISRPLACLLIENEGPRPLFRRKVGRKIAGWAGSDLGGRARVLEEPWAGFTLADQDHRQMLAAEIREHDLDVVVIGPLVCAGMEAAGTLQETREFQKLLGDVRRRADRRVAFILIHHENRAGKVSGAWEGTGDTLLHVTGMGRGKTRLHVQKARWASDYHAATLNLAWTEGDGFTVEDKPEVTDDDLAEQMLEVIAHDPGTGWTRVEEAIPGVRSARRRAIRDRLLTAGQLVNIGKEDGVAVWLTECPQRKAARLFLPDDPTIRHLRPDPDADGTQLELSASARGEGQ